MHRDEIEIGALLPLTGDAAIYGDCIKKGIDLAIDEINKDGGIQRKRLRITYANTHTEPDYEIQSLKEMISDTEIVAIIGGTFSQFAIQLIPLVENGKKVLISPTMSYESIPKSSDYIFSIYPSLSYEGRVIAEFTLQEIGIESAAVVYVEMAPFIDEKNSFVEEFTTGGGIIKAQIGYQPRTSVFDTIITKLNGMNIEGVIIIGYFNHIASILSLANQAELQYQFITISTVYNNEFFSKVGSAAENLLIVTPCYDISLQQPCCADFTESFILVHKKYPNLEAAYGYDVLKILALAIENSILNRTSIKDELLTIQDYPGVTGKTSFREDGSVEKELGVKIVKDQQFVDYINE